MDLDPVIIIKALNVAVLVVIGGALYVFWRASGRQPFLLHWSLYEFALAATVVVDGHMLLASLGVGIAVPLLLLGVIGYRQHKKPPSWAFLLLLAAVAVPAFTLAELFSKTYGLAYLVVAISIAYLAAAALFLREGGPLNYFVAAAFIGRTGSILLYPLWEAWDMLYVSYGVGQVFTLCAGVGMLMAGFAKAYGQLQTREQELIHAYNQSEELMLRLERRNEEYLSARQNAEAANAAKTQFLANMSHELRTPLNAILGFSEVLMVMPVEQVKQKVSGYARNIHDAAGGLQSIISDILNLSRVEAGALELQQEDCDLSEVLGEICRLMQPLADQKDITLEDRSGGPCPAFADRRLTRQALINGVSNAIKYTQRGGTVICQATVEDGRAVATVEDNGVGIDEMLLKKVFEPFWQEGNSFVAENTGVGLGLSIAKSYIEAQGGQIELKPAGQRGTIFVIHLPLSQATSRDGHAAA
jgi:signal transduction histidine kinase